MLTFTPHLPYLECETTFSFCIFLFKNILRYNIYDKMHKSTVHCDMLLNTCPHVNIIQVKIECLLFCQFRNLPRVRYHTISQSLRITVPASVTMGWFCSLLDVIEMKPCSMYVLSVSDPTYIHEIYLCSFTSSSKCTQ